MRTPPKQTRAGILPTAITLRSKDFSRLKSLIDTLLLRSLWGRVVYRAKYILGSIGSRTVHQITGCSLRTGTLSSHLSTKPVCRDSEPVPNILMKMHQLIAVSHCLSTMTTNQCLHTQTVARMTVTSRLSQTGLREHVKMRA